MIALGILVLAVVAAASVALLFEGPAEDASPLSAASAAVAPASILEPVASSTYATEAFCQDGGRCALVPLTATGTEDVTWVVEDGPGDVVAEASGASTSVRLPGTCTGSAYAVSLLQGGEVVDQVTIWVQSSC